MKKILESINEQEVFFKIKEIIESEINIVLDNSCFIDTTLIATGIDSINFMMLTVLIEEQYGCELNESLFIEKSYDELTFKDIVKSITIIKES